MWFTTETLDKNSSILDSQMHSWNCRNTKVTWKAVFYLFVRMETIGNISVIEKIHSRLNQSKGILIDRDHDLDGIPEEYIKSELQSQGMVSVINFTPQKWNYLIEPINTWIKQSNQVLTLKISEHCRDLLLQVLRVWLPSNPQLTNHKVGSCKPLGSNQ